MIQICGFREKVEAWALQAAKAWAPSSFLQKIFEGAWKTWASFKQAVKKHEIPSCKSNHAKKKLMHHSKSFFPCFSAVKASAVTLGLWIQSNKAGHPPALRFYQNKWTSDCWSRWPHICHLPLALLRKGSSIHAVPTWMELLISQMKTIVSKEKKPFQAKEPFLVPIFILSNPEGSAINCVPFPAHHFQVHVGLGVRLIFPP